MLESSIGNFVIKVYRKSWRSNFGKKKELINVIKNLFCNNKLQV